MKHRVFGSMMAMAAVVAVVSLMPDPAAGQVPATSRWNPPRLPGGQPDMQGLWIADAVLAVHSVEDGRDPDDDIIEDGSRFVSRFGERNPTVMGSPPTEEFLISHGRQLKERSSWQTSSPRRSLSTSTPMSA